MIPIQPRPTAGRPSRTARTSGAPSSSLTAPPFVGSASGISFASVPRGYLGEALTATQIVGAVVVVAAVIYFQVAGRNP